VSRSASGRRTQDVQLLEGRRLLVGRDEFCAQVSMLLAVVHMNFARVQTPTHLWR
jgi:hypothetical protein